MCEPFDGAQDGSKGGELSRTINPAEYGEIMVQNFAMVYEAGRGYATMHHPDTVDKIRPIVFNILQDNKIELIDITYRRESGGNVLRVSADTEIGITIDECARMNEVISEALDESNLMEDRYILEVASPGLDRPLKAKSDFLRVKGEKIRVHTYAPVENKKEFIGKLQDVSDEEISILMDKGVKVSIAFDKISSARLDF